MEIWKNCYGYEDQIQVSNKGRVRSFDRYVTSGYSERFVESIVYSLGDDKDGYQLVGIPNDGNRRTERVHRLVLLTFDFNENYKELTVNHIDGVKDNNNIENLEWATHKENVNHALETGLIEVKKKITYEHNCNICSGSFTNTNKDSLYCSDDCSRRARRVVNRPTKEQLKKDILNNSMTAVGEKYGVSDNAIRKWCRGYDLPYKLKDIKKMKMK